MKTLKEFSEMSEVTIVTHNGICHSDETLAVAVLMLYFNKKGIEEVKVIRTREITEVPEDSLIIDVFGGELDHHQMAPVYDGGRELASIGKVWRWGKTEFIEEFKLDETTWREVDVNLFKWVDITDNTGEMNPFNWVFNCVRNSGWEIALDYIKNIMENVLESMAKKAEEIREYNNLPVREIGGLSFRYSEKFLPAVGEENKDVKGLIWHENGHIKIRTLNGFTLKPGLGKGNGVIFTHKGGWIGEVESLEDLPKVFPDTAEERV